LAWRKLNCHGGATGKLRRYPKNGKLVLFPSSTVVTASTSNSALSSGSILPYWNAQVRGRLHVLEYSQVLEEDVSCNAPAAAVAATALLLFRAATFSRVVVAHPQFADVAIVPLCVWHTGGGNAAVLRPPSPSTFPAAGRSFGAHAGLDQAAGCRSTCRRPAAATMMALRELLQVIVVVAVVAVAVAGTPSCSLAGYRSTRRTKIFGSTSRHTAWCRLRW
jgi:hypothetical protein